VDAEILLVDNKGDAEDLLGVSCPSIREVTSIYGDQVPVKHAPLRTCVSCHLKMPKSALIRIVRRSNGSIELDLDGKKPGRGAYLCHSSECWQQALKKSRLEHALKGRVTVVDKEPLVVFYNSLQEDSAN
jgi:predicted RNA-binding protein YlxR (DUF448 family)